MLTIRSGGHAEDQLRISEAAGAAFQVADSAAGTVLSGNVDSSAYFSRQTSGIIAGDIVTPFCKNQNKAATPVMAHTGEDLPHLLRHFGRPR